MKTLLKICPNCDTPKKRNEKVCRECGYDFVDNTVYNLEDDIRETNAEIRKYIKREHRKDVKKAILSWTAFGLICAGAIYCYIEEVFVEEK